ncbi:hypothetical protein H5410_031628 [Solanum commersonii]|uniref:Uncharacterized protein n=1 Tax=Solanum commersonii TaxID=4109 RepID=A0A9J5YIU4_SOLCO|nr:hypothetical protein H5410_031628 [Solanum commersonii]
MAEREGQALVAREDIAELKQPHPRHNYPHTEKKKNVLILIVIIDWISMRISLSSFFTTSNLGFVM